MLNHMMGKIQDSENTTVRSTLRQMLNFNRQFQAINQARLMSVMTTEAHVLVLLKT